MTSSDLRDVLNLGDSSSGPRPSKKQKTSASRPSLKGLAREVLNLGGDNPIAIVPQASHFKKRRLASRKPTARWELRPFRNSGRQDASLILRHWRRKEAKEPPAGLAGQQHGQQAGGAGATEPEEAVEDSTFAKFNVKVQVPRYSADQYRVSLENDDWTKEETDYLMDMASDFDLRWTIIWDRYEWTPAATNGETDADGDEGKAIVPAARPRSMEDLKARYYEVAAKMMAAHKPVQYMTQQEYSLHELMAQFNPKQEKLRKEFAMTTLSRSKEEAREEESLLLETKRILARSERFNEERRELYNRLDYPRAEADISSFKSSAGLQTLLQNLMSVDKSKKRKSILGTEGASTPAAAAAAAAAAATAAQSAAAAAPAEFGGKRDSNAASNAATRESTAATSTPTAASKKAQQLEKQHQHQPLVRRKLSSHEEAVYGVTHHDRLGSGPTFRTERINKLFSHKSNQQQLRINNTLNELDVPAKLAMPTAATTLQYEQLLAAVNSLLDARKVSDKFDAEIKMEQAKKADRERTQAPGPTLSAGSSRKPAADKSQPSETSSAAEARAPAGLARPEAQPAAAAAAAAAANRSEGPRDRPRPAPRGGEEEAGPAQGDSCAKPAGNGPTAGKPAEDDGTNGKGAPRPGGSSGGHKRSASVLSAVSDKSAKRQKKQ
ncbi:uncharacterized protein UV8b_07297 [Ustilaginoidea virens]|uniref:SWR1-complex protein 4 n=1 Tax=Ustilaginoidea virens TaxID=1159556 RepID=A0A063BP98_USTVR|nr:uncharacterized protein UV8b_07297 [Ustilaginoidea virens]QUC23056.1 hypothetical protein UV8b_07297 [Ustilaginoidea virens]GAO18482.1 hypothetical protein UVI_02041820 [Ustilaginoidea virens]